MNGPLICQHKYSSKNLHRIFFESSILVLTFQLLRTCNTLKLHCKEEILASIVTGAAHAHLGVNFPQCTGQITQQAAA